MNGVTQGRGLFSTNCGQYVCREANPNMRVVIRSSSDDDCCGMAADLQEKFPELCKDMKQDQAENVEDYFDGYDIGLHSRLFLHQVLSQIVWTNFNREIQRVNELVRCWLANNAVAFELLTNEHTIDHVFTKLDIQEWGLATADSALRILRQRRHLQGPSKQAVLQTQYKQMAEKQQSLAPLQFVSQRPFSRHSSAPESLQAAINSNSIGPQGQVFTQREQLSAPVSANYGPNIAGSTRVTSRKDQQVVPRGPFPLLQAPGLPCRPQHGVPPVQQNPDRSQGHWPTPLPQHLIPPPIANSGDEFLRSMASGPASRGDFHSDPVATTWQPKLGYSRNLIAFESRGTRGSFQYERMPLSARQRGFQGMNPPKGIRNPPKITSDDARVDMTPADHYSLPPDPSHTVWIPTEFPETWRARVEIRPSSRTSSFGPGTGSAWDDQNRDVANQHRMHAFYQEYESRPTLAQEYRRRKPPPTASVPFEIPKGSNVRPTLDEVMKENDARAVISPAAIVSQSLPYALNVPDGPPLNENTSCPLARGAPSHHADPNSTLLNHAAKNDSLHYLANDRSRPPLTPKTGPGQQHIQQHSGTQVPHADVRRPLEKDCALHLGRIPSDFDREAVESLLRSRRGFCNLSNLRVPRETNITDDTPKFHFAFAYFDDRTCAAEAYKFLSSPEFKGLGEHDLKVSFAAARNSTPNHACHTWRQYPPDISPTKGSQHRTREDEGNQKYTSPDHKRSASRASEYIKRAHKATAGADSKETNELRHMPKFDSSKPQCQVETLAIGSGDVDQRIRFTPISEVRHNNLVFVLDEAPVNSVGKSSKTIINTEAVNDPSVDEKCPNAEHTPQKTNEPLRSVQTEGSPGSKRVSPLTKKKNNIKSKAKGGHKIVEPKIKDRRSSLEPTQSGKHTASNFGRFENANSAIGEIYKAEAPIDALLKKNKIAAKAAPHIIEEGTTEVLPNPLKIDDCYLPPIGPIENSRPASNSSFQKPELVLDMQTDVKSVESEPKAFLLLEQQAPPNSTSETTQDLQMSPLGDCVSDLKQKELPDPPPIDLKPPHETPTRSPKPIMLASFGSPISSRFSVEVEGSNDTRKSEKQEYSQRSSTCAPMSTTPNTGHMTEGSTTAQRQTRLFTLPGKDEQSGTPSPLSEENPDTLQTELEASHFAQSTAPSTKLNEVHKKQETQHLTASAGTSLQWNLGDKLGGKGTTITVTSPNHPAGAINYGETDNRGAVTTEALTKDRKYATAASNSRKEPQCSNIVPNLASPSTANSRSPERKERPAIPPRSSSLSQPPTPEPVMTHRRRQRIFAPVKEENDMSTPEFLMSIDVTDGPVSPSTEDKGPDGRISTEVPLASQHHSSLTSIPNLDTKAKQKMGSKSGNKKSKKPKATLDQSTDSTKTSDSTPPKTLPKPETPFIIDDDIASAPQGSNHFQKHEDDNTLLNEPSNALFDADQYYLQKDSYLEHLSKVMQDSRDLPLSSASQAPSAATSVKGSSESEEDIVKTAREAGYEKASSSRHFSTNDPMLARLEELYEAEHEMNPDKEDDSDVVLDFLPPHPNLPKTSRKMTPEALKQAEEEVKLAIDAQAARKMGLGGRVSRPHTPEQSKGRTRKNSSALRFIEAMEQLSTVKDSAQMMRSLDNCKRTAALLVDPNKSPGESSLSRLLRTGKGKTPLDVSPRRNGGKPDQDLLSAWDKDPSRSIEETLTLSDADSKKLKGLSTNEISSSEDSKVLKARLSEEVLSAIPEMKSQGSQTKIMKNLPDSQTRIALLPNSPHESHNISMEPAHTYAASDLLPRSLPRSEESIDATEILTEVTNRQRGESHVFSPLNGDEKGTELATAYTKNQNEAERNALKHAQYETLSDEKRIVQSEINPSGRKGTEIQKQLPQDEKNTPHGMKLDKTIGQDEDDRYPLVGKGKEREAQCEEDIVYDGESKQNCRDGDEQALQDETRKENAEVKIVYDASTRTIVQDTLNHVSTEEQYEEVGREIKQAAHTSDALVLNLDESEHFGDESSPATIVQDPVLTPPGTPLFGTTSPSGSPSRAIKADEYSVECEPGRITSPKNTEKKDTILNTRGGGSSDTSKNKKTVRGKGHKSSKSDPWALPKGEAPWGERKKGMSFGR